MCNSTVGFGSIKAEPQMRNFTSSFDRPRYKIAPKSVPHVQHDYFSIIQPIILLICDVAVAVSLTLCYMNDGLV